MNDVVAVEDFVRREWVAGRDELPNRINYACGTNPLDGWLNTDFFDGSLLWHYRETGIPRAIVDNVYNIDLLDSHPFPDNSFQYAFCEDFVEHLPQQSALLFLSEVYRTLAPGGVVRIATPSLDGVLGDHFTNADFDRVKEQIPLAYDSWGHVHFFCHPSLHLVAKALGFVDYRQMSFGQSEHAVLQNLESRAEQAHLNLYAEFAKPRPV